MKRGIQFVFFVVSLIIFSSCSNVQKKWYERWSGEVFGTFYNIDFDASEAKGVTQEGLDSVFARVNHSLSMFEPSSLISRVNQNDSMVVLDSLFLVVFEAGKRVFEETDGAFDMTVAPLVNCWGFGFKKSDSVTKEQVDSLMQFVGSDKVNIVGGRVEKKNPSTMLDASAIAKGFSCDCVANYLASKGCANFMVEIGGEIVCKGLNKKGREWIIGITKPTEDNAIDRPDLQEVIKMTDCGMATSGNYRQFYYKDGKRFSHTVNPKTGYPVEHNLLSATVIMPDCMMADAFATSFMVLGLDRSFEIASSHPEMAAYFIYEDDNRQLQVKYTDSFKKYFLEK